MIDNIDINKIVVSSVVSLVKRVLNILLTIKMLNKLQLYAYTFQNCAHKEKILKKLNVRPFWQKRKNCYKNIMKFGKNSALLSKKEFDGKPAYVEKYLKIELKSHKTSPHKLSH